MSTNVDVPSYHKSGTLRLEGLSPISWTGAHWELCFQLLLDWTDEDYEPTPETEINENRRLIYYVHLAMCAFKPPATPVADPSRILNSRIPRRTRNFEVIDRLCRRKSIRGRATIVLRLREVRDPEQSNKRGAPSEAKGKRKRDEADETEEFVTRDPMLKVMWRDPAGRSEGEVTEHFRGILGLAQCVWHSDAPGRCHCSPSVAGLCWASSCVATIAQHDKIEISGDLWDMAIPGPMDLGAKEKDYVRIDTTRHRSTSSTRKRRIRSYTVMSSIAVPLSEAGSPSEFMNAVLDAILAYWRLFNIGVLHRDINHGNVMVLHRGYYEGADADDNDLERQNLLQKPWEAALTTHEPALAESEDMLQNFLAGLNRSPTGILFDLDLHVKHTFLVPRSTMYGTQDCNAVRCVGLHAKVTSETAPPESKRRRMSLRQSLLVSPEPSQSTNSASTAHPNLPSRVQDCQEGDVVFRTGTPAFMSIRVLKVTLGTPYHHSYLDDLESFFWLIIWSIAAHLDEDSYLPTDGAQETLDVMNQAKFRTLATWKKGTIGCCRDKSGDEMQSQLNSYNNTWAKDPVVANIIIRLGKYLEKLDSGDLPASPPPATVFSFIVNIILEELGAQTLSSIADTLHATVL